MVLQYSLQRFYPVVGSFRPVCSLPPSSLWVPCPFLSSLSVSCFPTTFTLTIQIALSVPSLSLGAHNLNERLSVPLYQPLMCKCLIMTHQHFISILISKHCPVLINCNKGLLK